MKHAVIIALAMLAIALAMLAPLAAVAQDESSCKAYFQVLRGEAKTPGLRVGMDSGQKRWWENKGRKKYPALCLSGSVTSFDKPRYLVIWSNSKSIGRSTVAPDEIYSQQSDALQGTAPMEWIYKPRWNVSSLTILTISYDGGIELPPVYLAPGKLALRILWSDSSKVLEAAVNYLAQEPVFICNTSRGLSASK